jgi:hypothetical protein
VCLARSKIILDKYGKFIHSLFNFLTYFFSMEMVTIINPVTGQETTATQEQLPELQKQGWQVKPTTPTPTANSVGKSLSREERKQLRDRNLSHSLVVPSVLAKAIKDGVLTQITVSFTKFFKKKSGRTGSEYVAAQIETIYNNSKYTFCVLDDPENDLFEIGKQIVFNCLTTEDPAIRSGVVLELQK